MSGKIIGTFHSRDIYTDERGRQLQTDEFKKELQEKKRQFSAEVEQKLDCDCGLEKLYKNPKKTTFKLFFQAYRSWDRENNRARPDFTEEDMLVVESIGLKYFDKVTSHYGPTQHAGAWTRKERLYIYCYLYLEQEGDVE